ncbi:MAG: DUF4832 domain-containing protein [Bryobacterales bacterium]|nr:DUF4832 domain-containing protein [Bryobacterales bacterium]
MRALSLFFALLFAFSVSGQTDTVLIKPKPLDGTLRNPGRGIQTFQRFNGQALNPPTTWSEVGPEGPLPSAEGVIFPVSTVAYVRWFWSQIEPEPGVYAWQIIDSALSEAKRHGQKLAIRIMPYDKKSPLPEWYRNSNARRTNKPGDEDGAIWSPDSDDPYYITQWSALVRKLGERYDGHPDLDTVDISTFGYWGEGWGPYPPSKEVQQALIDLHFDVFRKTKLLVNFDVLEMLEYGTSRGAGWRADCWGDYGRPSAPNFAHMIDLYPRSIASGNVRDAWHRGPVSLEVCGTTASWKRMDYPLQKIFDAAMRWHASTINLKSSPIPEEWRAAFDEFEKRLGYRYSLRRVEYPRQATAGTPFLLKTLWLNDGVAPVYDRYRVELELASEQENVRVMLPIELTEWGPGDWIYEGPVLLPGNLPAGHYALRIAILDPASGKPAIQLANEGRDADGWYEVGSIELR